MFFIKTKLTDDPHRLLLRASKFQVDILETKKVILHRSINL